MVLRRTSGSSFAPKPLEADDLQSAQIQTSATIKHSIDGAEPIPNPDWWSDRYSILLLVALYTAQGLPMGLVFGSIPFLLKERGSSYADLAKFSLASLPYSLKLFIAPIVDSIYSPTFGRRKSWIVPVQIAIGCLSLLFASSVQQWVQSGDVVRLMPVFLLLMGLAATQDIAVDGWSLTMLRKENVSFASTCQSFGLSIGFFGTFTIYLAFSNPQFCDGYIRPLIFSSSSGALVDLVSTFRLIGVFFLSLTAYIALFKREVVDDFHLKKADTVANNDRFMIGEFPSNGRGSGDVENLRTPQTRSLYNSMISTYSDMFLAVRLSAVKSLVFCLLIAKFGMSAYDNGTLFLKSHFRFTPYALSELL